MTTMTLITLGFYILATTAQILAVAGKIRHGRRAFFMLGVPALCLHGYLLYQWIDGSEGPRLQNLYLFNVVSLLSWVMGILLLLTTLRKPVQSLGILVFPLAAISIVFVKMYPGSYLLDTAANPYQLIHILSALLAFGVLCVAALQAVLLAVQDALLRDKQVSSRLLHSLPPLEVMESLLFEIIGLGFVLLTFVVATSIFFFDKTTPSPRHSPYLVELAWLTFALLLGGRYGWGWRGRVAIRWTLAGVALLVLSYFSSLMWF